MSIAWDILLSSHAGLLMYANGTLADTKTLIPSSGLMDGVLQKDNKGPIFGAFVLFVLLLV